MFLGNLMQVTPTLEKVKAHDKAGENRGNTKPSSGTEQDDQLLSGHHASWPGNFFHNAPTSMLNGRHGHVLVHWRKHKTV